MYIYNPKKETKADIVIPIFLILISFVAIICSKSDIIPPAILQALSFISIALAIHVISRYSLVSHTYEADPEKKIFNVRKLQGKKITLAAAIEYGDIVAVDKKEKGYSLKKKYGKNYKIYNFCNNLFPRAAYCIVCDVDGEDIAVIIEADEILLDILERK